MTVFSFLGDAYKNFVSKLSPSKNNVPNVNINQGKVNKKFILKKKDIEDRIADFYSNTKMSKIVFDEGLSKGNIKHIFNNFNDLKTKCKTKCKTEYKYVLKINNKIIDDITQYNISDPIETIKIYKLISTLKLADGVDINLHRYGIRPKLVIKNSLVSALKRSELVSDEILNKLSEKYNEKYKDGFVPLSQMNEVADICQAKIIVKFANKKIPFGYGQNCIQLGLIDEHYFILEKTIYNSYAIKNYFDVRHEEEWNKIYKSDGSKRNYAIDSYTLLELLIKSDMLKKV